MDNLAAVLAAVDGLRADAAARLEERFSSVSALAAASREDLKAVKGVGDVMAGRILQAAMQAQAAAAEPTQAAKDTTARTAARATDAIDAATKVAASAIGDSSDTAARAVRDAEIAAKTNVYRLHATSDRAVDRASEAFGETAAAARTLADQVVSTAMGLAGQTVEFSTSVGRAALRPARKALDTLLGKR
jgi:NAD-dependent DNA ligase